MEINELVVNGDKCHCKVPTTFMSTTTPLPSDEVERSLSFSLQSNPGFSSSSFTSDVENNQVVGTTESLLQSSVEALRITPTEATATHTDTTAAATATAPPTGATTGATTTPTDAPETTATLLQSSTDNRMTNAWTEATTDTTAEEATSGEAFTELQSSTWNRRF